MITLLNLRHAATLFRAMREDRHLSQEALARRLHVAQTVVSDRERHRLGLSTGALIDTARVFGYTVALIPSRHPHTRPTGTGWPPSPTWRPSGACRV